MFYLEDKKLKPLFPFAKAAVYNILAHQYNVVEGAKFKELKVKLEATLLTINAKAIEVEESSSKDIED